ncbi:MAG: hypothetical protein PHO63_02090 [Bacilli bacterium]|nr:hypothetical protein [Bacilli bacterium]MDD4809439.1 hypothetical protein [Bacilli bacterium]
MSEENIEKAITGAASNTDIEYEESLSDEELGFLKDALRKGRKSDSLLYNLVKLYDSKKQMKEEKKYDGSKK